MSDILSPSPEQPQGQTRREFIRKVLLATAYAAPAIVSLSVQGVPYVDAAESKNDRKRSRSPMRPMSPMHMMSPMEKPKKEKDTGNFWK